MIPANASVKKGPEGKYPLHYLVWHNRHRELEKEVRAGQVRAPSGAAGTPRPGTPAQRGERARRGLSRLPGEFAALLCSNRGFCACGPGEGDGSGPRRLLSSGDRRPIRVSHPLRLG